jgi:hypothetical protein
MSVVESSNDIDFSTVLSDSESGDRPWVNGDVGIATVAVLNADLHVLYSGGGFGVSDQDLYYISSTDGFDNFGSPTEEIDAITVNFISANVYAKGAQTDTGWVFPGTVVGDRTVVAGNTNWTNPSNATADDGNNATVALTLGGITRGLAATNFDFSSIPAGAVIEGIEVRVGDYSLDVGSVVTRHVILIDRNDNDEALDRFAELPNPTTTPATNDVGGVGDLWGGWKISRDYLQDADFGFFIAFTRISETPTISVDFLQMKIHYSPPETVLAYVYDDGGVQKYNEKVLIRGADFLPYYPKRTNTLKRM